MNGNNCLKWEGDINRHLTFLCRREKISLCNGSFYKFTRGGVIVKDRSGAFPVMLGVFQKSVFISASQCKQMGSHRMAYQSHICILTTGRKGRLTLS